MIWVKFQTRNDAFVTLDVSGHADFREEGQDIVCAAVSLSSVGLLNAIDDHDAEWNFLKGTICYRRGWMDQAKRYYETACQMDPSNVEYARALSMMRGEGGYRPEGYHTVSTADCGDNYCMRLCAMTVCCNALGGGVYCLPCYC